MRKFLTFSVVFAILGIGAIIVNGSPNSPTLGGRVVLISEEDGDPISRLRLLLVPNDSLTDNGGGTLSLDTSSGDADEVAVAASTTALQVLIDLNITALAQVGIDTDTLKGLIDNNATELVAVGVSTQALQDAIDAINFDSVFEAVGLSTQTNADNILTNAVDISTTGVAVDTKVSKAGDTMTGDLSMSGADILAVGSMTVSGIVTSGFFNGDGSALTNTPFVPNADYFHPTDTDTGMFLNGNNELNLKTLGSSRLQIINVGDVEIFKQLIVKVNCSQESPSIRGTNDPDSGICFPNNSVTISVNSVPAMDLGVTNVKVFKPLIVFDKVGISTAIPQANLHVTGDGIVSVLIESNTGDEGHLRLKRNADEWGIHILADSDLIIHSEKTGVSAIHFKDTGEVNIGSDTFKSTFTASGNLNIPGTITATGLDCTDCVNTADIADATVTSDKIADGSITTAKFADICAADQVIARNAGDTAWECSSAGGGVALGDSPTWTGNHTWNNVLLGPDGAASAPAYSFSGDTNTGMFKASADLLGFATGGISRLVVGSFSVLIKTDLRIEDGTEADPGFQWNLDQNTGIFRPGVDTIGFTTAASERMRIDNLGNVGVNETAPNAKLEVKAALQDLFTVQISSQDGTTVWNIDRLGLEQPVSFTIAELKLISPRVLGQFAYCSDCTLAGGRRVESTGTSAGNWADADGSNWD